MIRKAYQFGLVAGFVFLLQGCYDEPVANFDYSFVTNVAPASVTFSNLSTDADDFKWEFGDGGTSTEKAPVHTYQDAGTFTIALTATGRGGENKMTKSINIVWPPTTYIVRNATSLYPVNLYSLSSYYWDAGTETMVDVVEHGTLPPGYDTQEVETNHPTIELAFKFYDHPDSTWYYAYLDPVFQIVPHIKNIIVFDENTTYWWFTKKSAVKGARPEGARKLTGRLKDRIE